MKTITPIFLVFIFACLSLQSCFYGSHVVNGNGNLLRKEFPVSDYNEISLEISANVIYQNDSISPPYLQVYADENILSLLNVEVLNGRLIIGVKDNANLRATCLKIITNSANLNSVNVTGSGKVELKGEVNAKEMKIDICGSGSFSADSLYCERAGVSVLGSGQINLKGVSNYTKFSVSGSGQIDAFDFSSLEANSTVSGSGQIVLWVGSTLNATVSGSGKIQYKGFPETKNVRVSGSGSISQIE